MDSSAVKSDLLNSSNVLSDCSLSKITFRTKNSTRNSLSEIKEDEVGEGASSFVSTKTKSFSSNRLRVSPEKLNFVKSFRNDRRNKVKPTRHNSSFELSISKPNEEKMHQNNKVKLKKLKKEVTFENENQLEFPADGIKKKKRKTKPIRNEDLEGLNELKSEALHQEYSVPHIESPISFMDSDNILTTNCKLTKQDDFKSSLNEGIYQIQENSTCGRLEFCEESANKERCKRKTELANEEEGTYLNMSEIDRCDQKGSTCYTGDTLCSFKHKNKKKHANIDKLTEIEVKSSADELMNGMKLSANCDTLEFSEELCKKNKNKKHRKKQTFNDKDQECLNVTVSGSSHLEESKPRKNSILISFNTTTNKNEKNSVICENEFKSLAENANCSPLEFPVDKCKKKQKKKHNNKDLESEEEENCKKFNVAKNLLNANENSITKHLNISDHFKTKLKPNKNIAGILEFKNKRDKAFKMDLTAPGNSQTNLNISGVQEYEEAIEQEIKSGKIKNKHKSNSIHQNEPIKISNSTFKETPLPIYKMKNEFTDISEVLDGFPNKEIGFKNNSVKSTKAISDLLVYNRGKITNDLTQKETCDQKDNIIDDETADSITRPSKKQRKLKLNNEMDSNKYASSNDKESVKRECKVKKNGNKLGECYSANSDSNKLESKGKKRKKNVNKQNDIDEMRKLLLEKFLHGKEEKTLKPDSLNETEKLHKVKSKVKKKAKTNEIDMIRKQLLSKALEATSSSSFIHLSEVETNISKYNPDSETSSAKSLNSGLPVKPKKIKTRPKNEVADIQQLLLTAALKNLNSKASLKEESLGSAEVKSQSKESTNEKVKNKKNKKHNTEENSLSTKVKKEKATQSLGEITSRLVSEALAKIKTGTN